MKRVSWYGSLGMGSFPLLLALAAPGWSADSPGGTLAASESQALALPAGGAAAPAALLPPDLGAEAAREESAASVASTFAPNMIGDMGGGPLLHASIGRFGTQAQFLNLDVPSPGNGILGRQRFADNDCTLPTDRVFFDASYFHEAELAAPMDASRFVPGFEKTFLCGQMSVEMRFPLGDLEADNLTANSTTFGNTGQFGDIQIILKAILLQGNTWTLGAGLDISVPTAPGLTIENAFGTPLMQIDNSSTHLLPYLALLVNPNNDWFVQAALQFDVAANGNPVSANLTGNGLTPCGQIYDPTLIFADATLGRWLYRNPCQRFSALAAVVEAHYTGELNAPSSVGGNGLNGFSLGYDTASFNVLDITVGAHAVIGRTTVTAGFATPLTEDRGFEGEFRFFVNRYF